MANKRSSVARENLLSAAIDVFGEKGFRNATIAEICRKAGANIAAVNYHFGSKEVLYREAWKYSFAESIKAHPQDGGVPADAPAEERLKGKIRALVQRIADPESKDFFISHMEVANPTGLLGEVMKSELIPLREKTLALVRELLGPGASEQQVLFCETCIISMCLHPMMMKRIRERMKKTDLPTGPDDIGAFADHVIQFALAGITSIRSTLDS